MTARQMAQRFVEDNLADIVLLVGES